MPPAVPIQAERLDQRVTFRRRAVVPVTAGNERGGWQNLFTVWAEFRRVNGTEALQGGRLQDVGQGVLRIRDSAQARTITNADRAIVQGRDYRIVSVAPSDRRTGLIEMSISTDRAG